MLKKLFLKIQKEGRYFAQAREGRIFEEDFKNHLKSFGFSEITQISKTNSAIESISSFESIEINTIKEKYNEIKKLILAKNSTEIVENPFEKIINSYIYQPYGSQNFPDFIVFTKKFIIPIEIKYSKNQKPQENLNSFRPMWNSNMPKANCIYLYGVAGENITFFKGSDILDFDTREVLLNFFQKLEKGEKNLNKDLENLPNNFGIYPYIRKAYEHKKIKSTFYDGENIQKIESYFSKNKNEREENVLSFLSDIENKN